MAARAHVARDYPFGRVTTQPRRDAYYRREDPVILPRSRGFSIDLRLVAAALAATALVTAGTYAVFSTAPPALAETPALPLQRDWSPSIETGHANALKALAGPALSTRSLAAPDPSPSSATPSGESPDAAAATAPAFPQSTVPERVAPRSSLPGSTQSETRPITPPETPKAQDLVPELPPVPEVYPNPTSTPPDGIAPPEASPDVPTPSLDPENPYR